MNLRTLIHPPADWLDEPSQSRIASIALIAVAGLAIYGFSVGYWRSPMMGLFVAVKLPLLIACTLAANGLLNGLIGLLLGSGLGFKQSLFALLSSFTLAALILGSLAPVTWLMAWNAPPPDSVNAASAHSVYLLAHTLLIATAGIAANLHLHKQLTVKAPSRAVAIATLLAWLGGNAILGAQFSWILRPFFGSPQLEVRFLRDDPMRGNFYQAVWKAIEHMTGGDALPVVISLSATLIILLTRILQSSNPTESK